ncbi:MAG: ATP:cob(I)alamin adenosyltransferase [Archaeoglobaceae archaeon]
MQEKYMKDVTTTSTLSGHLGKDSDVISGIGRLDEVNAFIGLAKVFAKDGETKAILEEVQTKIFEAGAEFAGGNKFPEENYEHVLDTISRLEKKVVKPTELIILEQNEPTGFLSVARAVVRRCERWAVKLHKQGELSLNLVKWLNKLSYLLYLLILLEMNETEGDENES